MKQLADTVTSGRSGNWGDVTQKKKKKKKKTSAEDFTKLVGRTRVPRTKEERRD